MYNLLSNLELKEELALLETEYEYYKEKKLALNMARGKPSVEQLELSKALLDVVDSSSSLRDEIDHADCANYGELKGTAEARAMLKGVLGSEEPWINQKPKFLCPVPGYDIFIRIYK